MGLLGQWRWFPGEFRRITKGGKSLLVAIRTTQNGHIAFAPKPDSGFGTLDEVDRVIVVASDDWDHPNPKNPKNAFVHDFDAKVLRDYFYRAREARTAAGQPPTIGIGVWLALYRSEDLNHLHTVGHGFGNDYPPVHKVALSVPTKRHLIEQRAEDHSEDQQPLSVSQDGGSIKLDVGRVRITIDITPLA